MTGLPDIVESTADLRAWVMAERREGKTVGLVPTMGALHQGHLSLIERIIDHVDRVIVSIFVNPKQFGEGEDFQSYPRDLQTDAAKLGAIGTHLIYAPNVDAMYPEGFAATVSIDAGLQDILCGPHRPGHFDGVTTVVTKLLNQCLPDVVIFGEKDYQQYRILNQLVDNLDLPVRVIAADIIREEDGLAMSSRNASLTTDQRQVSANLNRILAELKKRAEAGEPLRMLEVEGRRKLIEAGFDQVDYLDFRDAETLEFINRIDRPCRVLAVARLGTIRLLDNFPVGPQS